MSGAFYIRDTRHMWDAALAEVAGRRGYQPRTVGKIEDVTASGHGFIRLNSHPRVLPGERRLGEQMARLVTLIQDRAQIEVYDDKRAQIARWAHWMPETWIFRDLDEAMLFLKWAPYPLISKADVGASSRNVRYLVNREDAEAHLRQIFTGGGVAVNHCCAPRGALSLQKDYVILQRFIPHDLTYRVNRVGNQRAVFFRRCYPDRPMAQTGNTTPAYSADDVADLLWFADQVFADIESKWCALDILKDGPNWRLLETSLCWPWPSPGDCNRAAFFELGTNRLHRRRWLELFDVMFDEIEAGAWKPSLPVEFSSDASYQVARAC